MTLTFGVSARSMYVSIAKNFFNGSEKFKIQGKIIEKISVCKVMTILISVTKKLLSMGRVFNYF